jgi:hypothetical protein
MVIDPWLEHERLVDAIRERGWRVYAEWAPGSGAMAVRGPNVIRRPTLERLHRDILREDFNAEVVTEDEHLGFDAKPETEEDVWEWLGGYVAKLAPTVATYLHSGDVGERLHAFNKLDKYQRKASDGRHAMKLRYDDDKPLGGTDANRHGDGDEAFVTGHKRRNLTFGGFGVPLSDTSVSRKLTGRRDRPRDANAADADAARGFLERWATDHGTTLAELAAPSRRGNPGAAEAERLRTLGEAVKAARVAGFTQEAIGVPIGRDKRRVSDLERRAA